MLQRVALLSAATLAGILFVAAPALAETGLEPSPAQVEFGQVDIHFGGSPRQSVKFTNSFPTPVTVFSVAVSGPDAQRFQITNDSCSGQTVSMGPDSCPVEVSFEPGTPGLKGATLELFTSEGTLAAPLSGEGVTGTLAASPSR